METPSKEEGSPSGATDLRSSPLVLVVDDDADICQFISEALTAEGYRTAVAPDGQSALESVADVQPDLILLDVQMPKLDGWHVLQQLRAQAGPHQPIVVMTGRYEGQERALGSGAQGYLAKPFDLDDLLECVDLHSKITMENNMTERIRGHDA
jgi:CheY-like chemotaxis protein